MMNISNVLTAICSILFISIGLDKFIGYLDPPCSLMGEFSHIGWNFLGVMQIVGGILIWIPKFKKYIVGFFMVFMIVFTLVHLTQNTHDIGGSVFMAALLGLLVWNPKFIRGRT